MKEKYTCVIVDDEPKAAELLADVITELYPGIEITGTYHFWKPAFQALQSAPPDILFLDISMPQRSGLDLLDLLPGINSEIIFVTAFANYALDAFERCAAGYLLKPVRAGKMTKLMNKVLQGLAGKAKFMEMQTVTQHKLGIFNNNGLDYVDMEDIVFMEAVNRYTKVHLSKKVILSTTNIGTYAKTLSTRVFLQTHRSFLINMQHVKRYERSGTVLMSNGGEIPVSKNMREAFLMKFKSPGSDAMLKD